MSSSTLPNSLCVEVKLQVSHEIMNNPLGFVIDSGGSLAKIIYRSKEDYKNGKPLETRQYGILRLKSFTEDQLSSLVPFIKAHVDVALTQQHQDDFWWQTGIHSQIFKNNLEKKLNIKTKMYSEMMGLSKSLKNYELIKISIHKSLSQNFTKIAVETKDIMNSIKGLATWGDNSFDWPKEEKLEEVNKNDNPMTFLPPSHFLRHLFETDDYQSWIDMHLKHPAGIETPSLLFLSGSAGVIGIIDPDFKFKFVDYNPCCGKTLMALANDYVGEKDFDKFIKLAEEGDANKVNQSVSDIKEGEKLQDWYSNFSENNLMFNLGKLAVNKGNEKTHSQADLAAGVLSMQLNNLAKILLSCARIYHISRIYVCGSLFQFQFVRNLFEQFFYNSFLIVSLKHAEPLKLHFFNYPGYLVGLGVWILNVEKEKEKQKLESQKV